MAVANLFEWLKILPLKTSGLGVLAIVGILCYRGFPHKDKTPVKTVEDDADEELWKAGQTKKIGLVRSGREGFNSCQIYSKPHHTHTH